MDKKIRKFSCTENEIHEVHQHKGSSLVDINEIVEGFF